MVGLWGKVTQHNQTSAKAAGDAAEFKALQYLLAQGLLLVKRNYRMPGKAGYEIDLIMREPAKQGTLVFVEVRLRRDARYGSGAASVGATKKRRIIKAAQHFLMRMHREPACRFDVISLGDNGLEWIKAAFNAE
jgi:putative endonuclease